MGHTACNVAIGLELSTTKLALELPGFHQHRLKASLGKRLHQPFRQRSGFQPFRSGLFGRVVIERGECSCIHSATARSTTDAPSAIIKTHTRFL